MGAHEKVHIRKISKIPAAAKKWQEAHGRPCAEEIETLNTEEFDYKLIRDRERIAQGVKE
jgi:hypothetical protein